MDMEIPSVIILHSVRMPRGANHRVSSSDYSWPPGCCSGCTPLLGLGVLITLPLVLGLMHWVASPLRKRSRTEQAGLADAAASAADMGTGYRVIRGLHAQHTASHR